MAKNTPVSLFQGEDRDYVFTIKNTAETVCINILGWALSFMVKTKKSDADASALLTKTTVSGIVISGVFNASPVVNTQVASVTLQDGDTTGLSQRLLFYELKRTDAGLETVLAWGTFDLMRGVHR